MTYKLFIERRVQRQLSHIARPHRDRIIEAIRRLANDPRPAGVKKLTNREGWRIRVGNFRVIYEIRDESLIVIVVAIGHRREIYRP